MRRAAATHPGRSAPRAVRVLGLTAPVGEGHVSAARALREDILRQNPHAVVEICDALATLRAPLRWAVSDLYRWQLHKAPWLAEELTARASLL
jgi:hypothetical protein